MRLSDVRSLTLLLGHERAIQIFRQREKDDRVIDCMIDRASLPKAARDALKRELRRISTVLT